MKSLEAHIAKYGKRKGTRLHEGILKSEASKKALYASQPYKRLTKDWYLWRYGGDEGSRRFSEFAARSAHTLVNFIRLHGPIDGPLKYEQTISKKNTVKIVRESKGEGAVRNWYRQVSRKNAGKIRTREHREKISRGLKGSHQRTKDRLIAKFGEDLGLLKYLEIKASRYSGPNRATKPVIALIERLEAAFSQEIFDELYFGARDRNEYFIRNEATLFFVDIAHPQSKCVLEYNGAFWHPYSIFENLKELHPVTKKSLGSMYIGDLEKEIAIKEAGFELFKIHEKDILTRQNLEFDRFVQVVLERRFSK